MKLSERVGKENDNVGIFRKALFVGTGGASGLVLKANSKKERMVKAQEAQLKLLQRQERSSAILKAQSSVAVKAAPPEAIKDSNAEAVKAAQHERITKSYEQFQLRQNRKAKRQLKGQENGLGIRRIQTDSLSRIG